MDAFELCHWRRLLRVPWTARRSSKSILKESNPEIFIRGTDAEAEALATWCKELTQWKRPWCWKMLKAEGEVGGRGRDGWIALRIQWTWTWANSGRWWGTGKFGLIVHEAMKNQTQLGNWTTTTSLHILLLFLIFHSHSFLVSKAKHLPSLHYKHEISMWYWYQ